MEKDYLYRGLIDDVNVRFTAVQCSQTVLNGVLAHQCDPVASLVLGRSLSAALLLSPLLEDSERFSLSWKYEGPLGKVLVDVSADSEVRGMTQRKGLVDLADSMEELYGDKGQMSVVRSRPNAIVSSSLTDTQLMEVVDDLGFFFCASEQLETEFAVEMEFNADPENPVRVCRGLMLQAMPDCDYEKLDAMRQRMKSTEFKQLLTQQPASDNHTELLLQQLFQESHLLPNFSLFACEEPQFKCNCSREKTAHALMTLSVSDLQEYIDKDEAAEVACHFCSKIHSFGAEDISAMIKEKNA